MKLTTLFKRTLELEPKYVHLNNDASYYCENLFGTLYIYFEWSNGKKDWLSNLNFPAKPYRNMKDGMWFAHRGFLKVWKNIEPCLAEKINNPKLKGIVISGYSHGAAIALLCHEYCKFHRSDIKVEGYGFGCPRVVWGWFGKKTKKRFDGFTVIKVGKDLVTRVPPKIFGYRHIGNLLNIGQSSGYKSIEAHFADNYITELEVIENGRN